jgi:formate-dependent nitrite reductase membrane component NrfD
MTNPPNPRNRQRWAAAGGIALGAFALWLGPVATAVFLVAIAAMAVWLVVLRHRLSDTRRNDHTTSANADSSAAS